MTIEPEELQGRTVYGRKACKGKTGTITKVLPPDHDHNPLKPGLYDVTIEYSGYVGRDGTSAKKLLNDEHRDWTLDKDKAEGI